MFSLHLSGSSGEYLEVLSSALTSDLISVVYRNVDPECPDFEAVYKGVEQGMMLKFSTLKINFDRTAMLYLLNFMQGLKIR